MGVHVKLWSWFKGAAAFIKIPAGPRQGEARPDAPEETDDHAAEDASSDDIEIQPERQLSVEPESLIKVEPESEIRAEPETPIRLETEDQSSTEPASRITVEPEPARRITVESARPTSPEEINRRRAIVRGFFNDYWSSVEDKPASFAERLDRAEGYINERVAAGGEVWRLDPATRKQLGLPASKKA
jgi:hypothetical protein